MTHFDDLTLPLFEKQVDDFDHELAIPAHLFFEFLRLENRGFAGSRSGLRRRMTNGLRQQCHGLRQRGGIQRLLQPRIPSGVIRFYR